MGSIKIKKDGIAKLPDYKEVGGVNKNRRININLSKYIKGRFSLILVLSLLLILLSLFIYFIYKKVNVAKVNGEAISRVDYFTELHKRNGNEVLEELITKKLIFQEAKKQGISIPQSDIDTELDKLKASVEAQGSTLEEVLQYQGVTYDQLIENIKIQKILEVILKDRIIVSDEDIFAFYEENKDFYGNEKSFDELKEDIRLQLVQEKITSAYRSWMDEKKGSSLIIKFP